MENITLNKNAVARLLRKCLISGIPFLAILISYFVLDPFQVLYAKDRFDKIFVAIPNRDYVSTQVYISSYKKRKYSSFIMGNSRTMAFLVKDWVPYIHDSHAFHYDASNESLYGIWKKLEFLKENNAAIKHVLIVCDAELLSTVNNYESHLFRKDPRVTHEYPLAFQFSFLKAYFSNSFFYQLQKQRVTGKFTPDMLEMLENRRVYYDPITNDLTLPDIETEIQRDSLGYYAHNERLKRSRVPMVQKAVIGAEQLKQLVAIKNIFLKNHTDFQFVISPLYYQKQINPADLAILEQIFGQDKIHDYSGVNEFTAEKGNYYEDSHYRPFIGRRIMRQIYAGNKSELVTLVEANSRKSQ